MNPVRRIAAGYALLLAIGLGDGAANPATAQTSQHPRNEVAFYVEAYGEVSAADPLAARAHEVFRRVSSVADKNARRLPSLVVVDGPGDPWAIALPSGHIVVSLRALRICAERSADPEACMAFVLGHELAHLAREDFWHREVHAFLNPTEIQAQGPGLAETTAEAARRELAADDQGFIYAALAGFAVDRLVDPVRPGGFFEDWMRQSNARTDVPGAGPARRAGLLVERLRGLLKRIEFFRFGVRLGHFGYCDDAVYFFREFQKVYPGREVLNNLGFCYLQLARRQMSPERASFYWMPLVMDAETRAGALGRRNAGAIRSLAAGATGRAEGYLRRAAELLERAAAADPTYAPAAVNLAVARLYAGQPHAARAALESLAPADAAVSEQLGVLRALALFEQSEADIDLWPAATARLERLAERNPASAMVAFNLARLLEVRSRPAAARRWWQAVVDRPGRLPAWVLEVVCPRLAEPRSRPACLGGPTTVAAPPGRWPLSGNRLESVESGLAGLDSADWEAQRFDWFADQLSGRILTRVDGGAMVLELDRFVQMQVLRKDLPGGPDMLVTHCPSGLDRREVAAGRILSCGNWAALVSDDGLRELWWLAR